MQPSDLITLKFVDVCLYDFVRTLATTLMCVMGPDTHRTVLQLVYLTQINYTVVSCATCVLYDCSLSFAKHSLVS